MVCESPPFQPPHHLPAVTGFVGNSPRRLVPSRVHTQPGNSLTYSVTNPKMTHWVPGRWLPALDLSLLGPGLHVTARRKKDENSMSFTSK